MLAVTPRPPAAAVDAFLQRLGLDGSARLSVAAAGAPAAAAFSCSARALAAGVLDVAGASPRRFLFQVLAQHAGAALERERLQHFASAEGRDDLYRCAAALLLRRGWPRQRQSLTQLQRAQQAAPILEHPAARRYNQREGRTLLEVLQDFPSAQPPLAWLLQAAPLLRPRLFSISSGPALHPRAAHVTAAVVRWATPFRRAKQGLCSAWLAGLQPAGQQLQGSGRGGASGSRVPVWVERGSLRLPADPQVPLLLVGPGTGVAPFRSFLQQRQAQAAEAAAAGAPAPAPCVLFFGCRSAAADFYYADEWRALQAAGVLHPQHGLQAAFSRDQPAKVYVTHCIRRQAALVWALLQRGARVYVAGSADRMPADVAAAFRDVAAQQGGFGAAEAERFVRQLQLGGRYFVEAWS